jgi:hypothetical protein
MATSPKERGAQGIALSKSPILRDAVAATQEWAMRSFHEATSADEAWNARLRAQAVEEFVAYLLAVIALGRQDTAKLLKERDEMSERKKKKQSVIDYLDEARKERAKFDLVQQKVADG